MTTPASNTVRPTDEEINEMLERFPLNCKLLNYTPKGGLLSNVEAAKVCGYKPNTLEQKRKNGTGPRYIRPNESRRVMYAEPILLDWLASGLRESTCA